MKRFEYDILKHKMKDFNELVYFCSESGECLLEDVSVSQTKVLGDILNSRGVEGWELIQLAFGNQGIITFWKREL